MKGYSFAATSITESFSNHSDNITGEQLLKLVIEQKEDYLRRLKGMLRTLGTSASRLGQFSKEVFQETLYHIVRLLQLGKYKEEDKFDKLFMSIARNLALAHYRKWKKQSNCITDTTSGEIYHFTQIADEQASDPIKMLSQKSSIELRQYLLNAIDKELNPTERLVLKAYYFEGLQASEIELYYELSLSNVKTTLHRSRKKLNKRLAVHKEELYALL